MEIYSTLSARREHFVPHGDVVRMYVCGVTPYAPCHLGHAMSYIVFDMVRRYLEFRGHRVKHVQNFTDIDDKIIARANEQGIPSQELAERFITQYFADIDALNVKRADVYPRATEEVPKIIEVIEGLIQKGHAYEVGGDVYFRVRSCPDYGKLSRRNLDDMMAGARIEVDESKEAPLDFALWKAAKPGEPEWQSPWGQGRPGWHIECSAMSLRYLGEILDIHGGGQDLVFPHHENEIAQSESFTGVKPFVRHWIHNGLMQLGEDKMSKSSGMLVTVSDALAEYSADALRLWVLNSHYRSPIVYADETLEATEKGIERLRRAAHTQAEGSARADIDVEGHRQRFIEGMDDDFGSPQGIAVLFDLAREINRAHDEKMDAAEAQKALVELAGVLGLTLREPVTPEVSFALLSATAAKYSVDLAGIPEDEKQRIESTTGRLVQRRNLLRDEKKYDQADGIRDDLKGIGILLEDTSQGTVWRYSRP
jgi:cysteinyl-tRNA synthetase